jgi:integrase
MRLNSKLTKHAVERAQTDLWDGELRGFGVRVHETGRKTFTLLYRMPGTRRVERLTIGTFGELSVDEARKRARLALADVSRGANPAEERRSRKLTLTVAELGESFLEDVRSRRKSTTAVEYSRLWNKHIVPALAGLKITEVTTAHVAALHRSLRKTPYLANRVLALVGSFFTYAAQQGARSRHSNPSEGVTAYAERKRERYLSAEEFGRLAQALVVAERYGLTPASTRRRVRKTGESAKHRPKSADTLKPANPVAVAAIRFLILTGWREREALRLRWSELDFSRKQARLLDTKNGQSARHLGAAALLLLSELDRVEGNPHVFPGAIAGEPLIEINRVWYAVRHAAGLDDVRLHDLRHSYAATLAGGGESLLVIGKLMGHKRGETTQRYAHLHDNPLTAAADAANVQIAAWMSGVTQAEDSSVVPISAYR